MSPAGLEPTIPACERPQTHALDRAATEIGSVILCSDYAGTVGSVFLRDSDRRDFTPIATRTKQ